MEKQFFTLLNFFKALANESRLKLIGILADRECSVEELALLLDLKEPTVSHHLSRLKDLNLVQMHIEGNTHLYRLNRESLQTINQAVFTPETMAHLVNDVTSEPWEEKVLQNFLEGDTLLKIPASRKKRRVILNWLVKKFKPDQAYPEKEVNTIIKRYHPDCATLRRELIAEKLMQRDREIYQRI